MQANWEVNKEVINRHCRWIKAHIFRVECNAIEMVQSHDYVILNQVQIYNLKKQSGKFRQRGCSSTYFKYWICK